MEVIWSTGSDKRVNAFHQLWRGLSFWYLEMTMQFGDIRRFWG
jgi:hypothetical protein